MFPELPPKKNRPPRILEETVFPELYTRWGNRESCPPLTLQAYVTDPDPDSFISVKWYLNPSGAKNENDYYDDGLYLNNETQITREPAKLVLASGPGGRLSEKGQHRIELLVSDGTLIGRAVKPEVAVMPDGGLIDNPRYIDSVTWVIDVEDKDCE